MQNQQTGQTGERMTCSMHDRHDEHMHGPSCGHDSRQHRDHMDYQHDGHWHAQHESHWDDHEND